MVPANYRDEYLRNAISSSSPGRLIVMMYDGAIKFAKMALKNIDENDATQKNVNITKAHNIVHELAISLDFKKGGEVTARLNTLYLHIKKLLMRANIASDRKALKEVIDLLTTLHEAWQQIIEGAPAAAAEETTLPPQAPPSGTRKFAIKC